jgi:hypothetical protein
MDAGLAGDQQIRCCHVPDVALAPCCSLAFFFQRRDLQVRSPGLDQFVERNDDDTLRRLAAKRHGIAASREILAAVAPGRVRQFCDVAGQ